MEGTESDTTRLLPGRLVVITGTGTSIGKTHVAEALILAWRRTARVVGLKPVESGVSDPVQSDAARLGTVSSFHVKQSPYAFSAPISPHLAARDEGIAVRMDIIAAVVRDARQKADVAVVELAGGLFTPIAEGLSNADLARALAPDSILLVAPDRLGVLHDVVATARAATMAAVQIDGIVLVAPDRADASTGRNAAELQPLAGIPVWAVVPRGASAELSKLPVLQRLMDAIAAKRNACNHQ
jgi:dethiobiotin synthetase